MKIPQINSNIIKSGARSFVAGMAKSDVLAPVILLELFVTGGRSYQAYKRGGFIEARERVTEESLGAIFWLSGVTMFNKFGDMLGKKFLKLMETNFDTCKDFVRRPLSNYLSSFPKFSKKMLGGFKAAKIVTSILLANTFVGIVVPKVNQAITKKYQSKISHDLKPYASTFTQTFEEFSKIKGSKSLAFKGAGKALDTLLSLTHKFENDAKYKLLSTDAGVLTGRTLSARNNDERLEIAFRDFSSIYFYMFASKHINKALNKAQIGRATRLDPVSAKQVDVQLQKFFKNQSGFRSDKFLRYALGNQDAKIPMDLKFSEGGIIRLDDFLKQDYSKTIKVRAKKMAQLQPATTEGLILTKNQVLDVFKGGVINNPDFLNSVQKQVTGGNSVNPYKYVEQKQLDILKEDIEVYVKSIIKKAKVIEGDSISIKGVTKDLLKKVSRNNFIKNSLNLGGGLVVSALFLSTIIPKVQYWITKTRTGKNEFPGVKPSVHKHHNHSKVA